MNLAEGRLWAIMIKRFRTEAAGRVTRVAKRRQLCPTKVGQGEGWEGRTPHFAFRKPRGWKPDGLQDGAKARLSCVSANVRFPV